MNRWSPRRITIPGRSAPLLRARWASRSDLPAPPSPKTRVRLPAAMSAAVIARGASYSSGSARARILSSSLIGLQRSANSFEMYGSLSRKYTRRRGTGTKRLAIRRCRRANGAWQQYREQLANAYLPILVKRDVLDVAEGRARPNVKCWHGILAEEHRQKPGAIVRSFTQLLARDRQLLVHVGAFACREVL